MPGEAALKALEAGEVLMQHKQAVGDLLAVLAEVVEVAEELRRHQRMFTHGLDVDVAAWVDSTILEARAMLPKAEGAEARTGVRL